MNLIPIITEYLQRHRRLVVPQLGAFIRKSEQDEVVFTEMLKRDDGILRSLLMEQGLGEIESSGVIDRFIFELRHAIADGSVYNAEGLGLFALGENGTIRFRYLPRVTPPAEATEDVAASPETTAQGQEPEAVIELREDPRPEADTVADTEADTASEVGDKVATEQPQAEQPSLKGEAEPQKEPSEPIEQEPQAEAPELEHAANEKRSRIKELMRFSNEHPREHRSSSQPRREDPSVRGLRYGKPQHSTDAYTYVNSTPSRRPDTFIILAVLAVVIALGAILYGYWNDRRKERIESEYFEQPLTADPIMEGAEPSGEAQN